MGVLSVFFFSTIFLFMLLNHLVDANKNLHFVLVHGAGHGAWCWYKVSNLLQQQGHRVDAIDLTSAGRDSADATTVGGLENYSLPLIQLLQSVDDKVILVGHSLGGASLTYAMENFPSKISRAIYVAALMYTNNSTQARLVPPPAFPDSVVYITPNGSAVPTAAASNLSFVRQVLYHKSPLEDVVLAKSLLKPVPLVDPYVNFTSDNYGRIPRYYIKTKQDQSLPLALQEEIIQRNPPVKVRELDTDHSPFFSMSKALVDLLLHIWNE